MMRIAVSSNTFSADEVLCAALRARFPGADFNPTGRILAGDELLAFLGDAPAALVGLETLDARLLAARPALRTLAKFGVGLDNIDLEHCARAGIAVLSTPGVNAFAVAELALGLMLGLARRIAIGTHHLKQGRWVKNGGVQVFGKTVGLIGLGHVGRETARVLQAVGCTVLAHDILDLDAYCAAHAIAPRSLDALLGEADIVSLHVPLTPRTRRLIGRAELARMKPTAFLVNTTRGGVVDEEALHDALADGTIAGAASDVFAEEPTSNARLLAHDNFIATPHVAGNSREAIRAVGMAAIENLTRHLA